MGHYDTCYDSSWDEEYLNNKELALNQLKLMLKFKEELVSTCGDKRISKRHLDAFQDMINETELRTKL